MKCANCGVERKNVHPGGQWYDHCPFEPDSDHVWQVDVEEYERLREKVELAIHALLPVIPISGSWNSGYSVPDHIHPTVHAMVEEWGDAALAVADLHAELTGTVA